MELAATAVDDMPTTVAAIAANPKRRADVDENARTIIAANTGLGNDTRPAPYADAGFQNRPRPDGEL